MSLLQPLSFISCILPLSLSNGSRPLTHPHPPRTLTIKAGIPLLVTAVSLYATTTLFGAYPFFYHPVRARGALERFWNDICIARCPLRVALFFEA